jgi:predicted transcriptional regulator
MKRTVTLPDAIWQKLTELAKSCGRSRSKQLEQLVIQADMNHGGVWPAVKVEKKNLRGQKVKRGGGK